MILIIDNYDSFTYNLVQYIGTLNPDLEVYRNDKIAIDEIKLDRAGQLAGCGGYAADVGRRIGLTIGLDGIGVVGIVDQGLLAVHDGENLDVSSAATFPPPFVLPNSWT